MPPSSFKEVVLQLVSVALLYKWDYVVIIHTTASFLQKEIMASYDSSLIVVSGATAVAGTDFRETLDAMIDPLLQICDIGAEKLSEYDRLVYKANCLQYVRVRIISFVLQFCMRKVHDR